MPTRPIGELCTDPVETRARAARRSGVPGNVLPVPCYRCIAWTGSACRLIENPPRAAGKNPVERAEQLTAFPTPAILDSRKREP